MKFKNQNTGYWKIVSMVCLVILISSCSSLKETWRGFAGVSTKELEAGRQAAIVKTLDYDYFTSFTKVLDALKEMGAYIYAKDIKKHMIAIYVSDEDTTPVGIFFIEASASSTQIEVSSPSKFAKEGISGQLFKIISPAVSQATEEKKGDINAEK